MRKLVLLCSLIISINVAMAQVTTSSISGNVVDDNGVALIGATIKATHIPTGTIYAISTQKSGNYNIGGMRVGGPYTVEASYIGCNTEKVTDIMLTLGEDAKIDFKLCESTQTMNEIVVVGKNNPVFSSNRTGAQSIISNEMMQKLPTINRSLSDFTKLTPMSSGNNFGGTSYRYNNVTVDGASFNNSFGLSDALGAKGTEPISLEALDQVQVMIAPYDVRNGAFTGAAINSVTKSGTNEWNASLYYYMKHPDLVGYKQKELDLPWKDFTNNQKGFTLAGPIIKNKLFFFINGEMDRQQEPINWRPRPNNTAPAAGGESVIDVQTLQNFSDFLNNELGYDPGTYNVRNTPTQADRITARIDWNIDSKNSISVKYFYLNSFNTNMPSSSGAPAGGRAASATTIPFSSVYYRTNNNFNIVMADLNTTINETMSNTLKVGYSALRDFRDVDGGFFPQVDILNGVGWNRSETDKSADFVLGTGAYTTIGTENNSYNNMLNSDIFQIQDNFTWNLDKHQLTFGTQSDLRSFKNGYGRSYAGEWVFNSFDEFYKEVNDYAAAKANGTAHQYKSLANKFSKSYSLLPDSEFPYAKLKVLTLGFYVQDKWAVNKKLNITLGLRVDTPIFLGETGHNEALEQETFQGNTKVDVSKMPKTMPLFSPRIGFNWDITGDRNLQLRGGSGLFSGTPPYVWLSNQMGNNGLFFGSVPTAPGFDGDINYRPSSLQAAQSDIAVSEDGFKYPQLWKSNVAIDSRFGRGWTATIEVLYNKDVNNIYHANIALPDNDSKFVFQMQGDDNRTIYMPGGSSVTENQLRKASGYGGVTSSNIANSLVMMKNTSKGYSIYTTFQVSKDVIFGALRGLNVNASYTFGRARSVSDGSSSVAKSAWQYRPAVNPNAEELGFSGGSFPNRLLVSASYRKEYAKNFATSIGVIYQRYMPFRYSYTYKGDLNNDGIDSNDLIFIPESQDQIELVNQDKSTPTAEQKDDLWKQLDEYISQDKYLSSRRGQYAERNGGVVPYVNRIDINITQDFYVTLKNGKRNTVRFSFDVQNFGNMLNKNWGVQETTFLGSAQSSQYQFLQLNNAPTYNPATQQYTKPSFFMPYAPNGVIDKTNQTNVGTFKDLQSAFSRWSIQFGVKYMFN